MPQLKNTPTPQALFMILGKPMITLPSLPLPTAEEMRRWDSEAVTLGIPEAILMENAAREALRALQEAHGSLHATHILLFMGNGNNGGDAACLARHLLDLGAKPLVLHTKPLQAYTGVTKQHIRMAKNCGVPLQYVGKKSFASTQKNMPAPWQQADIVVDGLLGTGLDGPLRPQFMEYIHYINACKRTSFIFSLDIPSGCSALTGLPHAQTPVAVQAHATVCFAAAKPGLVLPCAAPYTGKLFVRSIGIPRKVQENNAPSFRLLQGEKLGDVLTENKSQSHKGSFGHVLVLGGSRPQEGVSGADLSGAAHLAALSALRTGAGLVTAAAPSALCAAVKNACPNIMTLALTNTAQAQTQTWPTPLPQALVEKISQVQALAIGPGMGTDEHAYLFLQALLAQPTRPRAVLDADALTLLAKHTSLRALVRHHDMLTPHPGEAARFLQCTAQEVQTQRFTALNKLTNLLPCAWLLKGAGTLIKQQGSPTYILPRDIPSLALAGSGDVLTGCVAALAARMPHTSSLHLLALGACVHAQVGLLAQEQFPQRGHVASDLAHFLPKALQQITTPRVSPFTQEDYTLEHL